MKRLIFAALMPLMLTGCGLHGLADIPAAPVEAADETVLDEQGMAMAEYAYKASRLAGETLVDGGQIRGETALRVAALDRKAFAALGRLRTAYRAANATSYEAALTELNTAIGDIIALLGRTGG